MWSRKARRCFPREIPTSPVSPWLAIHEDTDYPEEHNCENDSTCDVKHCVISYRLEVEEMQAISACERVYLLSLQRASPLG